MIDHVVTVRSKPTKQAQLHGHEHDGEDDADDRRDEAKLVVKEVARGQFQNQRHGHCNTL